MTRLEDRGSSLYVVLPVGAFHGWGVCGRHLLRELAGQRQVRHLWPGPPVADGIDDVERAYLQGLALPAAEASRLLEGEGGEVDAAVLQSIRDHSMLPGGPYLRGRVTVGYTFFERTVLQADALATARQHYDLVVAGSTWCEGILRRHGFTQTATVLQGIDPQVFHPAANDKQVFADHLVIFSGGKLSLRKGHDIVIRAVKILQDRHRDVLLVNAWYNPWPATLAKLAASPHLRFEVQGESHEEIVAHLLAVNGLDLERVITVPARPNALMAQIYKNTDVGLFPNRCEGGTNLVLMEYMACGKPAIASLSSGHKDILTHRNCRSIETLGVATIHGSEGLVSHWDEPDLEETVEHLEWAYHHREELRPLGRRAAQDLSRLTWPRAAAEFLEVLGP